MDNGMNWPQKLEDEPHTLRIAAPCLIYADRSLHSKLAFKLHLFKGTSSSTQVATRLLAAQLRLPASSRAGAALSSSRFISISIISSQLIIHHRRRNVSSLSFRMLTSERCYDRQRNQCDPPIAIACFFVVLWIVILAAQHYIIIVAFLCLLY